MIAPYFSDGQVTLYLGDMREVLPALDLTVDAVITDCPYGETSLKWDRWVDGWPTLAATAARSMWCFGSMRMLLEHGHEFTAAGWKFSQDIVWEKHNGSGFHADRFKRVHESATHWYRGDWNNICHDTPRIAASPNSHTGGAAQGGQPVHTGTRGKSTWTDDGTRLMRSVQYIRSMHGRAIHSTEKPIGILDPLVRYACPSNVRTIKCIRCTYEQDLDLSPVWDRLRQSSSTDLLQSFVQGQVPDQANNNLLGLPPAVPSASCDASDLLTSMCGEPNATAKEGLRTLRSGIPTDKQQNEVLFSDLRVEGDRADEAEETHPYVEGLPSVVLARSSDGKQARLPAGTPKGDGGQSRETAEPQRSRSSQERDQERQPAGKSGSPLQSGTRPHSQTSAEAHPVPALRGDDRRFGACPDCGCPLIISERRGVVLDLFAGSGSTLDSARQTGRRAIGIEGDEKHIEAAAKRLSQSVIDFEAAS